MQESASASKQAAVESDEEARRRRRELAVKALKKSLAQQESVAARDREAIAPVEQARVPANTRVVQVAHETQGPARPAMKGLASHHKQRWAAQVGSRFAICHSDVLLMKHYLCLAHVSFLSGCRAGQNATANFGMKRSVPGQDVALKGGTPHRSFPGKEEVVYEDI